MTSASKACKCFRVWFRICNIFAQAMHPVATFVTTQHPLTVIILNPTLTRNDPICFPTSMSQVGSANVQSRTRNNEGDLHIGKIVEKVHISMVQFNQQHRTGLSAGYGRWRSILSLSAGICPQTNGMYSEGDGTTERLLDAVLEHRAGQ